jgi:UDP-N-acetylglucosamine 4,6-dehydratase (inverting)
MFKNKTILISGGTGTLGQSLTKRLLELKPKKIIIYSRDEFKQDLMSKKFNSDKLRFFIGDVRDRHRLEQVCRSVDYIVHAAALKQVPACEYNPVEAIRTNIDGAINIINAAIKCGVKKVVALSTDKAVNPINLYGATKLCSDKLFVSANNLSSANNRTMFSVVRYGNVAGSRGSVIPFFEELIEKGEEVLPVTDHRMTRFYITTEQGVELIETAFNKMKGGEIFVSKIPSFRIVDYVAFRNKCYVETGTRPGEKLHEIMITSEDSRNTYEFDKYYIIYPEIHQWLNETQKAGEKVVDGFSYSSDNNSKWLYE